MKIAGNTAAEIEIKKQGSYLLSHLRLKIVPTHVKKKNKQKPLTNSSKYFASIGNSQIFFHYQPITQEASQN